MSCYIVVCSPMVHPKKYTHGMHSVTFYCDMMTSSNGNIFRVSGPLWGESTGRPWRGAFIFYLRLNKQLSKQSRRRWFETPSRSFWHHCNDSRWLYITHVYVCYYVLCIFLIKITPKYNETVLIVMRKEHMYWLKIAIVTYTNTGLFLWA